MNISEGAQLNKIRMFIKEKTAGCEENIIRQLTIKRPISITFKFIEDDERHFGHKRSIDIGINNIIEYIMYIKMLESHKETIKDIEGLKKILEIRKDEVGELKMCYHQFNYEEIQFLTYFYKEIREQLRINNMCKYKLYKITYLL
jgi:hypothetical protein